MSVSSSLTSDVTSSVTLESTHQITCVHKSLCENSRLEQRLKSHVSSLYSLPMGNSIIQSTNIFTNMNIPAKIGLLVSNYLSWKWFADRRSDIGILCFGLHNKIQGLFTHTCSVLKQCDNMTLQHKKVTRYLLRWAYPLHAACITTTSFFIFRNFLLWCQPFICFCMIIIFLLRVISLWCSRYTSCASCQQA